MSTLIRTFILGTKNDQLLINLAHVSSIKLTKKILTINMANENNSIYGSYLWFDGSNRQYKYKYENEKDALDTYNSIQKAMQQ